MSDDRQFWLRFNARGCVTGSVLAEYVGPLAEDAHKEFTPKVADRRREAAQGVRFELVDQAGFSRALPCIRGECDH